MREALEMRNVRPHDFRRTGVTNLTGVSLGLLEIVEGQKQVDNVVCITAINRRKIVAAFAEHNVEITNGDGTGARLRN